MPIDLLKLSNNSTPTLFIRPYLLVGWGSIFLGLLVLAFHDLEWDAAAGSHEITVRATDATGYTQTEDEAPPAPDGATGWHRRTVSVS